MFGQELFNPPYSDKIIKALPTLFNMVEIESKRGDKLGMEVGTARERVIIALFMYVYGGDAIIFPESTSHEKDVIVNNEPVSIKTKMGKGYAGVKLTWTTDWQKVKEFETEFVPQSHLLFININWGDTGGFFLIPCDAQKQVLNDIGRDAYFKLPKHGTNPRGVEISAEAMKSIQGHGQTQTLSISWKRDHTLLTERSRYEKWIELWDTLA